MEVATARVYNWDVQQRPKDRTEEGGNKAKGKGSEPSPND